MGGNLGSGVRPIYGSCRAIIAKSHLLALKLAEEELACDASHKKNTGVGTELQGLDCKPWGGKYEQIWSRSFTWDRH